LKISKAQSDVAIQEGQTTHWSKEKKDKRSNNDQQSITQKTKDGATRIAVKIGDEFMCSRGVGTSCSTFDTLRATA
jgi:hypothetical protein